MISGALLLRPSRQDTITNFWKRRMHKVFLPALGWCVIYLTCTYLKRGSFSFLGLTKDIVQGPMYYHMWYLYMLFGLYLAVPVLSVYMRHAERNNVRYFLLVSLFAASIIPFLCQLFHVTCGVEFVVMTGYVGYFVAGRYFLEVKITGRQRTLLLGASLIAWITTVVGTYLLRVHEGAYNELFLVNTNPAIVVLTLTSYFCLKDLNVTAFQQRCSWLMKLILLVSSASFSIYLMHPLFLRALQVVGISSSIVTPLIGVPVIVLFVLIISLATTLCGRQLPLLKYFFP
jgi:surface polysaccharide O-acyltransferase-like enzyme